MPAGSQFMWSPACIDLEQNARQAVQKRTSLGIVFYTVKHDKSEPWINRLAAYVTKGNVSHVELRFPDGVSTGIYNGEDVFMRSRSYANPQYVQCKCSKTRHFTRTCFALRRRTPSDFARYTAKPTR